MAASVSSSIYQSSLPKATGEAKYVSDIQIPGCLVGRVVRSPYPHARLVHLDVSAARNVRGVFAVVTAKDIPGKNRLGKTVFDQPILVEEKARSLLDAVVLIAAENDAAAREAEERIIWKWEKKPAVFSWEDALTPGAPLVHNDHPGNLLKEIHLNKGDVEAGFAMADLIVEDEYQAPSIEHCYFEPDNGVIQPSEDGRLILWIGCHSVYSELTILSQVLNIPTEKILVIQPFTGGSFGGKDDGLLTAYLGLLATYARKSVRISFSRHEMFISHTKRHPQWINVKAGFKRDGHFTAAQITIHTDTGAYAHWAEGIFTFASIGACGPYRIPHQKVNTKVVYTNNIPMGAMRAWGMPGVTFAMESTLDIAAKILDLHPLLIRYRNAAQEGDMMITGSPFPPGIHIREVIQTASTHFGVSLTE